MQLEYIGDGDKTEQEENAEFRRMRDFAFFAANFGYSKAEYEALTPAEVLFLCKAHEDRIISGSTLLAAAVANAVGNVFRKKGKQASALWKKHPRQGSLEVRQNDISIAKEMQKADGDGWLEQVYRANGRTFRRKEAFVHDEGDPVQPCSIQ